MPMIKFSVLIPAYKRDYLSEAINSVVCQSYTNFELIIVDDCSPEDLQVIVEEFHDERIRYYRNSKNCGAIDVVNNWNICLSYATGDYVICMGDDDKLLPNCLEEYARLIEKHPNLGVYHGWTQIIDENSKVTDITAPRPEFETVLSLLYFRICGRQQYIGDFLFNKELLVGNNGFYYIPLAWGSDDISAYIAASRSGIANTQIPVFQYRINSLTISKSGNMSLQMRGLINSIHWIKDFISDYIPKNELDILYMEMINKRLDKYEKERKTGTIYKDLYNQNLLRIFFWFRNRKKYSVSTKEILKALLYYFM